MCCVLDPVDRLLFGWFQMIGFVLRRTEVKNEHFYYLCRIENLSAEQLDGIDGIICLPVKVNREKQKICVDNLIEVRSFIFI